MWAEGCGAGEPMRGAAVAKKANTLTSHNDRVIDLGIRQSAGPILARGCPEGGFIGQHTSRARALELNHTIEVFAVPVGHPSIDPFVMP